MEDLLSWAAAPGPVMGLGMLVGAGPRSRGSGVLLVPEAAK